MQTRITSIGNQIPLVFAMANGSFFKDNSLPDSRGCPVQCDIPTNFISQGPRQSRQFRSTSKSSTTASGVTHALATCRQHSSPRTLANHAGRLKRQGSLLTVLLSASWPGVSFQLWHMYRTSSHSIFAKYDGAAATR